MSLALNRTLVPATRQPSSAASISAELPLTVTVIFTTVDATLSALKQASALAESLRARISLIVPQVVPFPLPLTSPPVLIEWNERRFQVIASGSPIETKVSVYFCRDQMDLLAEVLNPGSLVVLGTHRRWWWPTPERRLARKLRKVGHEVVLTELE